jgi:hypothetical protein
VGDGDSDSRQKQPCLKAAVSRALSGQWPDNEDRIEAHARLLHQSWVRIIPHNHQGMCDLFVLEALDGRAFLAEIHRTRVWVMPPIKR